MKKFQKEYNLEERTAKFGENIIILCKRVKSDHVTEPIIRQLVRAGTSVGANYTEANGASSKKDFRNKIFICKKEIQETKHWLRMLGKCGYKEEELRRIQKEAQELSLIFGKISATLNK